MFTQDKFASGGSCGWIQAVRSSISDLARVAFLAVIVLLCASVVEVDAAAVAEEEALAEDSLALAEEFPLGVLVPQQPLEEPL